MPSLRESVAGPTGLLVGAQLAVPPIVHRPDDAQKQADQNEYFGNVQWTHDVLSPSKLYASLPAN